MSSDSISVTGVNASNLNAVSSYFEAAASGSRLNRSSDGPAEMAISNEMLGEIAEIHQGMQNIDNGISMLQVAEGSLETVSDNLTRMKQLAVQASSGIYSDDQKKLIAKEFNQLKEHNQQIGQMTSFNGITLHQNQSIDIAADAQTMLEITTQEVPGISPELMDDPEGTIAAIEASIDHVNSYRSSLGAKINTFGSHSKSMSIKAENVMAAESRISNADMARVSAYKTATQIAEIEIAAKKAHNQTVQQLTSLLYG